MSEMQAVGFSEFGGPEVLGLVSLPVPVPGPARCGYGWPRRR